MTKRNIVIISTGSLVLTIARTEIYILVHPHFYIPVKG
jgi:hypothetical protein